MANNNLIQSLKKSGYTIKNIIPATPMTMLCIELSNGVDISYEKGIFNCCKELANGKYYCAPFRYSVVDVIADIPATLLRV
jgi:hypothetical protein